MIVDHISPAILELQAQAESLMVTACQVVRSTGVTWDPVTGADVATSAVVYTGGCKIQSGQTQVLTVESGDGSAVLQQFTVHLPVTSGPYLAGDVVLITGASRRFRVQGVNAKTWETAQRLPVEELL